MTPDLVFGTGGFRLTGEEASAVVEFAPVTDLAPRGTQFLAWTSNTSDASLSWNGDRGTDTRLVWDI